MIIKLLPDIEFSRCIAKIHVRSLSNINEAGGRVENKEISIIVTPVIGILDVYKQLKKCCIKGKVIPIWDIIGDVELANRLKYINRL